MRAVLILSASILLAFTAPPAPARSGGASCIPRVSGAWVRMAPASMPMGAAFATVDNRCGVRGELTGVESPDFGSVSIHETRIEGGVSRMRSVRRLAVPPRERIAFRPGGLHIMLSRPQRALGPGKVVRLVFRFGDGRTVRVDAPVRDSAP